MSKKSAPFFIGIPIYEGVDLLDVTAPYEMFNWMGEEWKATRETKVFLVAASQKTVKTRDNLVLTPDTTFKKCPQLDLLWVPGGDPTALMERMQDCTFLNFLKAQSEGATYVTSVCEGALLLASAGLLDGHEATTHWAFVQCLKLFPHVKVADGYPRFVVSGNRITGGGISSGLDEALKLMSLITDEATAKKVQLTTQYFPHPPFDGGIPDLPSCKIDKMPATIKKVLKQNCGKEGQK